MKMHLRYERWQELKSCLTRVDFKNEPLLIDSVRKFIGIPDRTSVLVDFPINEQQ